MSSDVEAAVAIMAEATSHFVQDPYATEALEALLAAGWSLTPPPVSGDPTGAAKTESHPPTFTFTREDFDGEPLWEVECDRCQSSLGFAPAEDVDEWARDHACPSWSGGSGSEADQ